VRFACMGKLLLASQQLGEDDGGRDMTSRQVAVDKAVALDLIRTVMFEQHLLGIWLELNGDFVCEDGDSMDEDEREYEYKPKWTVIFFGAAFFGVCAVVLGSVAANNDRGLIINHMIELEARGATVFYWILMVCSLGMVGAVAFLVYHRLMYRQRIKLGMDSLIVPASRWSQEEKEIAYSDIQELSRSTINGNDFLHVKHVDGKSTITASMMPSKAAFEEVCKLLAARFEEEHPAD
jgi:hypothetical protein